MTGTRDSSTRRRFLPGRALTTLLISVLTALLLVAAACSSGSDTASQVEGTEQTAEEQEPTASADLDDEAYFAAFREMLTKDTSAQLFPGLDDSGYDCMIDGIRSGYTREELETAGFTYEVITSDEPPGAPNWSMEDTMAMTRVIVDCVGAGEFLAQQLGGQSLPQGVVDCIRNNPKAAELVDLMLSSTVDPATPGAVSAELQQAITELNSTCMSDPAMLLPGPTTTTTG